MSAKTVLGGFNTQPPEGGCSIWMRHSFFLSSFNTQPPEGGCPHLQLKDFVRACFNTQPPEGGWIAGWEWIKKVFVSTHSRPKAAVADGFFGHQGQAVSTHSRPKAAGI